MSSIPMPVSMSGNLKLEEGELICDKCEGKGGHSNGDPADDLCDAGWVRCQKCQGGGKVDWIENIVGKKPEMNFGSSSTSISSGGTFAVDPNNHGIHDDMIDAMSKQLADQIDKEILESLVNHSEQIDKQMKKAANVFADMGGMFDNGIISKFMLFFATKPEVKDKENEGLISRRSRHIRI